jgi:subtilisin family serine protease
MESSRTRRRWSVAVVAALALVFAGTAGAERYVVVFKQGKQAAGRSAVARAGGTVIAVNKVSVATVEASMAGFADALRATGAVDGVAPEAAWRVDRPGLVDLVEQVPGPVAATGCAQQYGPPGGVGIGPDSLSVCQWDMRAVNASPAGSYAVNRGRGTTVAILDTGVDYTHPDIEPNFDLARSCSFIRPDTPDSDPRDIETTGRACLTKSAIQDWFGHGSHVAGIVGAPINGLGVAGVAPETTLVGLKVCTTVGFCYTQPVVDALIYAGDMGFDVANMSFFVDPNLYNCRNDEEGRAIWQAVHRAAQYATQRGVVLVASAGNHAEDLDHPAAGNECVVVPAELPTVATVSATGPAKQLSFYSAFGASKVDVAAPGGDSMQAPNPYGRVLNVWGSEAPPLSTPLQRQVEECQTVGGAPVCALYGWIQGTSMAAPHAAGVAALIRAVRPSLPALAVIARMQSTAMPMYCPPLDSRCRGAEGGRGAPHTSFYGSGLVDALAAGTR